MKRETKQDKLEKQRKTFLKIGFVVALAIVLAAFEWKTYDYSLKEYERTDFGFIDEDIVEITKHEEPTPPPPKAPPVAAIIEVDNEQEVVDVELFNPEANQFDSVPEFIYIRPEEPEEGQSTDFFPIPEVWPEFPGGESALLKYLASNISFTNMAIEAHIDGTVLVGFIVEKDGSVSSVTIKRSVGAGLDEVAMEAVKRMPGWSPGKQRGMPVRVPMVVPIKFKLQ